MNGLDRYNLSPLARRRREIVADIELGISFAEGALFMLIVGAILRAFGLL